MSSYSYLWNGSQAGWTLLQVDQSTCAITVLFDAQGPSKSEIRALRRAAPCFRGLSAAQAALQLRGRPSLHLGEVDRGPARSIVKALAHHGLRVHEEVTKRTTYLPFNEIGLYALLSKTSARLNKSLQRRGSGVLRCAKSRPERVPASFSRMRQRAPLAIEGGLCVGGARRDPFGRTADGAAGDPSDQGDACADAHRDGQAFRAPERPTTRCGRPTLHSVFGECIAGVRAALLPRSIPHAFIPMRIADLEIDLQLRSAHAIAPGSSSRKKSSLCLPNSSAILGKIMSHNTLHSEFGTAASTATAPRSKVAIRGLDFWRS